MENNNSSISRGQWTGRVGFILATAGSAVGLGNIWKFPYITGVHGGGAFVLVYLLAIVFIGLSVMIAELVIGRSTQLNPIGAIRKLAGKSSGWQIIGFMGVIAAFVILSFYSVVAGWIMDYIGLSVSGQISYDATMTLKQNVDVLQGTLGALLGNGWLQVVLHLVFMAICTGIVMFGIKGGIEKAANILMPLLFVMLVGLFIYTFFLSGSGLAWDFLFNFHFDSLTPAGVLEAVGHAFFTLSLGMGAIITYGSYLSRKESLVSSSFIIAALDTVIALMAGIVIFSIVFSFNFEPGAGPALIFATLPSLFAQMPGGPFISTIFFFLVLVAAITSAISIFEVVVAYFVDTFKMQRKKVTIIVGIVAFLVGILSALSYNELSSVIIPTKWLFGVDVVFFDLFDKLASNILLPVSGLLIALFVGWRMNRDTIRNEFKEGEQKFKNIVLVILRFIAPVLILVVVLQGLGFTQPFIKAIGIVGPEEETASIILNVENITDEDEIWYLVVGEDDMYEDGTYNIEGNAIKFTPIGIKKIDKSTDPVTIPAGEHDVALVKMSDYGDPTIGEGTVVDILGSKADQYEFDTGDTVVFSVGGSEGSYTVTIE